MIKNDSNIRDFKKLSKLFNYLPKEEKIENIGLKIYENGSHFFRRYFPILVKI